MKIFTMIAAVILLTCTGLFAQVNLEDGLVASYPFNGDATDASGNGNDGTVTTGFAAWGAGTPILTTDRNDVADQAYYFDMGGNIEVPYSTILNPGTLSISWWIYMEERANNDYMISLNRWDCFKVNLQDANKVFFTTKVDDPDNPGSFIYNDRDNEGDGLVAEQWYHLAVSFGNGHMKFYIDGVLVKDWDNVPNSNIADISADPVNLVFGQERPTSAYTDETGDGGWFKGKMDDIKIYNRVLSDDEVMALSETAVSVRSDKYIRNFELRQNYPNPFSNFTTIEFSQLEEGYSSLIIMDAIGQEIVTLISQNQYPGNYKYNWDAGEFSAGIYFYRLSIDGVEQTRKLYLIK